MTRNEIIEQLNPIAGKIFKIEDVVLTDEMSAETVEEWTSLAFMQLLTAVEEHFGFKFKMMELLQLKNMGDIIDAISNHVS